MAPETLDEWGMLAMLGWTVVEVPDLHDRSCAVTSQRVVLLRAGVDDEGRQEAGVAMLDLALQAEVHR